MKWFRDTFKGFRPIDWVVTLPWIIGIPFAIIEGIFAAIRLARFAWHSLF